MFAEYNNGKWTPDEDARLQNGVCHLGENSWKRVSEDFVSTRSPRKCRERWNNYFKALNYSPWTDEEDDLLIRLHDKYGSNWARISNCFIERNAIDVKSRYQFLSYKYFNDLKLADKSWTNLEVYPRACRTSISSALADFQELDHLDDKFSSRLDLCTNGSTAISGVPGSISCDPLPSIF